MEEPKKTLSGTSRRESRTRKCLRFRCREKRRNLSSLFFAPAKPLKSPLPVTRPQVNNSSLARRPAVAAIWWGAGEGVWGPI